MAEHDAGQCSDCDADYDVLERGRPVARSEPGRRSFGSAVGAFDGAENGADSGSNASRQIAGAEARHNFVSNDPGCAEVCQRPFETIPDFDADSPFMERDEQEDAVVGSLLAQLPGRRYTVGEFFERLAFERGKDQQSDLIAGAGFMDFQLSREFGNPLGRQNLCEIHDAASKPGDIERGGNGGEG
jgi:hypothetical protein